MPDTTTEAPPEWSAIESTPDFAALPPEDRARVTHFYADTLRAHVVGLGADPAVVDPEIAKFRQDKINAVYPPGDWQTGAASPAPPDTTQLTRTPTAMERIAAQPNPAAQIGEAVGIGWEALRREVAPLFGPTEAQKIEDSVAIKNPDGSTRYEYKPLGGVEKVGLVPALAEYAGQVSNPSNLVRAGFIAARGDSVTPESLATETAKSKYVAEPGDTRFDATSKAVFNATQGLLETFTNPAFLMLPGSRALSGAFAADMLSNVKQTVSQAVNGKTTQEKIEGALGTAVSLGLGGLAGTHSLSGGKPVTTAAIAEHIDKVPDTLLQVAAADPGFVKSELAPAVGAELNKRGLQPKPADQVTPEDGIRDALAKQPTEALEKASADPAFRPPYDSKLVTNELGKRVVREAGDGALQIAAGDTEFAKAAPEQHAAVLTELERRGLSAADAAKVVAVRSAERQAREAANAGLDETAKALSEKADAERASAVPTEVPTTKLGDNGSKLVVEPKPISEATPVTAAERPATAEAAQADLAAYLQSRGFDPAEAPVERLSDAEMKKYPITRAILDFEKQSGVEAPVSGKPEPAASKPVEQMSPEEFYAIPENQPRNSSTEYQRRSAISDALLSGRITESEARRSAGEDAAEGVLRNARTDDRDPQYQRGKDIAAGKPFSAVAVEQYGIKLPEGYTREGGLYVFKPTEGAPNDKTQIPPQEGRGSQGQVDQQTTPKEVIQNGNRVQGKIENKGQKAGQQKDVLGEAGVRSPETDSSGSSIAEIKRSTTPSDTVRSQNPEAASPPVPPVSEGAAPIRSTERARVDALHSIIGGDRDAAERTAATINKNLATYGEGRTEYQDAAYDRVTDDLLANKEATGNPFKTPKGANYSIVAALRQEIGNLRDKITRREEGGEAGALAKENAVAPSASTEARVSDAAAHLGEAIDTSIAGLSADPDFQVDNPGVTSKDASRAARVVLDRITEQTLGEAYGFSKGQVGRPSAAVTKLIADPQFEKSVREKVLGSALKSIRENATEDDVFGFGPGAAAKGEIPEAKTVPIRNGRVDEERIARGELPLMSPARKAMGKTWDEGMARIERDPNLGNEMTTAILNGDKKDVSESDHAVLLHEKIRVMNERSMESDRISDPHTSEEDRAEARARWAALEDRINDIDHATQQAGTITGRALQFRKALVRDDYTFAGMERKERAVKDRPLTPEESATIKADAERIAEAERQAGDREQAAQEEGAGKATDAAIKQMRGDKAPVDRGDVLAKMKARIADGDAPKDLGSYLQKIALSFVRAGITEREPLISAVHDFTKDVTGFDPRQTRDAVSGYGDFKPLDKETAKVQLRQIKGESQQISKLEDMAAGTAPKKTGIERREPSDEERALIKQVNEAKKEGGFDVTDPEKQLRSALDSVKTRLKNQIRDATRQFDTGEKSAPSKPPPTDLETEKLKALRDRVKESLAEVDSKPEVSPEMRVKRAKDALERSIKEYDRRLEQEDFARKTSSSPETPELKALRAQRDALRAEYKTYESILHPERETASRIEATKKLLAKQLADMSQALLLNERIARPKRAAVTDAANDKLRELRDQLKADYDSIFEKPELTDEQRLARAKGYLTRRAAELEKRIADNDFAPRPKAPPVTLDPEGLRLRARVENLKDDFQRGLVAQRLKNRSIIEKAQDTFVKWRRGFILSSPITLAKLTSAAIQRMTITPIEEAVGAGISKLIPSVADRAPREGGLNVRAEAKAITEGFTRGMSDAWNVLKTGHGDLDSVYGKKDFAPRSLIDFIGSIHGALKAPTKRNEFARSFEKRVAAAMTAGVDATDPMVQTRIATEAYKDANRSIFMQDNRVVSAYKRAISALEQPDKATGKTPAGSKALATTARVLLPIIKVPTNIVAETMQYAVGSVTGSVRLANALRKGVDTLPPEQAELIMRSLKKGSLGAGLLLIGYFNADSVGGYYQPGKRDEKDVKAGGVRVFGFELPSYLVHNPLLETMQIGATIRRVADSKLHKKDTETQGTFQGVLAAGVGLGEEVPFVKEMFGELPKLLHPNERGQFFGELAKSLAIPSLVDWVARKFDTDASGEPVKRKPETLGQHLEMGVPGLRQRVPEKTKKVSGKDFWG